MIGEATSVAFDGSLADHVALHQAAQPVAEDVGRDVLGAGREVLEARLADRQVADDEHGPFVAEQVQAARDGAGGAALGRRGLLGGATGLHGERLIGGRLQAASNYLQFKSNLEACGHGHIPKRNP